MKRLEVFLPPLDRMLVHRRSIPSNFVRFPHQFAGTHLYTRVERGTVRVKCLVEEHNTMSPARARTRTARSGVERTNLEATAPPIPKRDLDTKKQTPNKNLGAINRRWSIERGEKWITESHGKRQWSFPILHLALYRGSYGGILVMCD